MDKGSKIKTGMGLFIVALFYLYGCGILSKPHNSVASDTDTQFDLYLLIGQSNMAGRAAITPSERDTLKNVYLFTGKGWETAANPLNKYSTVRKTLSMQKLGPGYGFAKELERCTHRKIGLIVNARGGTAIEWWGKGYTGEHDYDLYEKAVEQAKEAKKYGHLKSIIWHQGESNKSSPENYMALLKKLVRNLRHDLGTDVYFVGGEIGKWRQTSVAINQVIRSIPHEIKHADYASTDGLKPLKGDTTNPHFDTRSQLVLGKRYADQVLKSVYGIKACKQSTAQDASSLTPGSESSDTSQSGPAKESSSYDGKIYSIKKHFDNKSKTGYYLTRIKHIDAHGKLIKLNLSLTDKNKLMGETASEFASRTKAALVFNASMSKVVSTSSGEDSRIPVGIQIIGGKILQERTTGRYTLGIKDNNELVVYPSGTTAQEILDDGTNTALTAFVPLIEHHQSVSDTVLDDVKNLSLKNPRQVIAQFDNLDILFLTCGGRGHGGEGMTAKEVINVLKKLNVKFAYNLDGGGSISTVLDGNFINWKIDGHGTAERPRANFLYVQ